MPEEHARTGRWRALLSDKLGFASLVFLVLIAIVVLLAPVLAPYSPDAEVGARLLPPLSGRFLLGTDDQGRDVLSRLIWGGRPALIEGIVPVAIATAASLVLGLAAGYRDGPVSHAIMRFIDLMFALPMVLVAVSVALLLSPGLPDVIITVSISATPYLTRVVYADVRRERHLEYAEAARVLGFSPLRTLVREILPNVLTPLIVYATTLVGIMIVFTAGLSFLGVGVQPPAPDWGNMVTDGASVLLIGDPYLAASAGIVILVVALAFNWLGDAISNLLDPNHVI